MIHVTTTCADLDQARDIARDVLNARLAACVNITPGVVSLFHWQGQVEEEHEVTLVAKTTPERRADLVAAIQRSHPYDLPVITWEEVDTTPDARRWCYGETSAAHSVD